MNKQSLIKYLLIAEMYDSDFTTLPEQEANAARAEGRAVGDKK